MNSISNWGLYLTMRMHTYLLSMLSWKWAMQRCTVNVRRMVFFFFLSIWNLKKKEETKIGFSVNWMEQAGYVWIDWHMNESRCQCDSWDFWNTPIDNVEYKKRQSTEQKLTICAVCYTLLNQDVCVFYASAILNYRTLKIALVYDTSCRFFSVVECNKKKSCVFNLCHAYFFSIFIFISFQRSIIATANMMANCF